ncbi:MAG: glycoside hydrolase [Gammaproteobacteria bacterium]|nr:glycoside hydrolase [Gammaproteobacteria bacterium]
MSDKDRLKVVLCWHMHQPDYRGPDNSDYQLPWVYLHGIKDYADMAVHIENNPKSKAVVNFAPVLLDQIEDYVNQIDAWLSRGTLIRDPLLAALAGPGLPVDQKSRQELMSACLKANEERLIKRFRTYHRLVDIAGLVEEHHENGDYLNDQYLADLLIWYHLAWMGEYARINDIRVKSLEKKRIGFDADDRRRLVAVIGDLMASIVPRYKKLAEAGQVELSVTPYAHPIVPLLLDINTARESMPDVELPEATEYPGGEARSRWHIRKGLETFERHFGFKPKGCWPSEGAVSSETVQILEEEGFRWAASGQQVLHNSLSAIYGDQPLPHNWVHQPYRVDEGKLNSFFRDDGLSDLIGFEYADWHGDDAVNNLVQHLENINDATKGMPNRVVSIIMDGENAWEYYPRNGCFFLNALYDKLSHHPDIKMTTFSKALDTKKHPAIVLPDLIAGSWVYGTFSTWIGEHDKNRAWDMLVEAKQAYDKVVASGVLDKQKQIEADVQMATCEGSDWFWWFGDYNPGDAVSDFEKLYRRQLKHLYRLLGIKSPAYLDAVFAQGSGDPSMGGVMRKNA